MTQEQNFDINDGQNFGVSNVAEFYNDVHVYGKLYADLVALEYPRQLRSYLIAIDI